MSKGFLHVERGALSLLLHSLSCVGEPGDDPLRVDLLVDDSKLVHLEVVKVRVEPEY